jgi:hypothetical protein
MSFRAASINVVVLAAACLTANTFALTIWEAGSQVNRERIPSKYVPTKEQFDDFWITRSGIVLFEELFPQLTAPAKLTTARNKLDMCRGRAGFMSVRLDKTSPLIYRFLRKFSKFKFSGDDM